jgi:hypothetical protein
VREDSVRERERERESERGRERKGGRDLGSRRLACTCTCADIALYSCLAYTQVSYMHVMLNLRTRRFLAAEICFFVGFPCTFASVDTVTCKIFGNGLTAFNSF